MTTIRHRIRRFYSDGHKAHGDGWSRITLPAIPGVVVTTDRQDTEPRTKTIRSAKPKRAPAGVALTAAAMRRVQWVKEALMEDGE